MKILMTGATGLLGKNLGIELVRQGYELVCLVKKKEIAERECPFPATFVEWDPSLPIPTGFDASQIGAVIHLLESDTWSVQVEKECADSALSCAKNLLAFAKEKRIGNFISTSHIKAEPFWHEWEKFFLQNSSEMRLICLRIGTVLDRQNGLIKNILPYLRRNLKIALGSGKQWLSWIHKEDLIQLILFSLKNEKMTGIFNATALKPIRQSDFFSAVYKKTGAKSYLKISGFLLKIFSKELFFECKDSIKIFPDQAIQSTFQFKFSDLDNALDDIFLNFDIKDQEYLSNQFIPKKPEEIFPFFSDEKNLEKITPAFLHFKVLKKTTHQIEENTLIDYRLKIYGIPFYWQTRILNWEPPIRFVDTQVKGPYQKWHHTHLFTPLAHGTLMTDHVHYKVPLGLIGDVFVSYKILSDVKKIFSYRKEIIYKLHSMFF